MHDYSIAVILEAKLNAKVVDFREKGQNVLSDVTNMLVLHHTLCIQNPTGFWGREP